MLRVMNMNQQEDFAGWIEVLHKGRINRAHKVKKCERMATGRSKKAAGAFGGGTGTGAGVGGGGDMERSGGGGIHFGSESEI